MKIYPKFVFTIKIVIIVKDNNYDYKHTDNRFYFCKSYYYIIIDKKIPKFRFANCINILPYQKYFDIFNNLTSVKKAFIICAYLFILIIKLRPSSFSFSTLYY